MKTTGKARKILCIFLCLVMLVSIIPPAMATYIEEYLPQEYIGEVETSMEPMDDLAVEDDEYILEYEDAYIELLSQPSPWAREYVEWAIAAGLVPSNLQSNYTQVTTRTEFAALAVRLYENLRGEIRGRNTFADTDDVNVQKAAYIGVVQGVGNNRFAPNDTLTREQAATMLTRLADAIGVPLPRMAPTFADNSAISSWAFDAVGHVQAVGIMGGVGNNIFSPGGSYTREQSIVTILRLFEWSDSDVDDDFDDWDDLDDWNNQHLRSETEPFEAMGVEEIELLNSNPTKNPRDPRSWIGQPAVRWRFHTNGTQCPQLPAWYADQLMGVMNDRRPTGSGNNSARRMAEQHGWQLFRNGNSIMVGDIVSFRGMAGVNSFHPQHGHAGVVYQVSGNTFRYVDQWNGSITIRSHPATIGRQDISYVARPPAHIQIVGRAGGTQQPPQQPLPPQATAPTAAPTNVRANGVAPGTLGTPTLTINRGDTLRLTWNAVANATRYRIEPMIWNGSIWVVGPQTHVREVNGTSVEYRNIQFEARHWRFRITAGNAAGWSSRHAFWHTLDVRNAPTTPQPTRGTAVIRYRANGGTGAPASHSVQLDAQGVARVTLSTVRPTRSGDTFLGWRLDNSTAFAIDRPGQSITINTGNATQNALFTYYAQWQRAQPTRGTATIRYNANGGTGAPASHTVQLDAQGVARFTLSTVRPTRSGYTFLGWRLDNSTAFAIDRPGQSITINTGNATRDTTFTYFAQWQRTQATRGTATIRYNANGGTGAPASHTVQLDAQGVARFTLSTVRPTRSGYTFLGWRLDNSTAFAIDRPGQSIAIGTGSATRDTTFTYFAQWQRAQATLTGHFRANGGVGAPASVALPIDTRNDTAPFDVPRTVPTRSGHRFMGWGGAPNCPGTGWFQPGDRLLFTGIGATRSITLYAQWARN